MTLSPDALAAEIARLRAENEALARKATIDAFVARRKMEDHMDAPVGTPLPGSPGRVANLRMSSPASADAWARLRPAPRAELTPIEKEKLGLLLENQKLRALKMPRRERG